MKFFREISCRSGVAVEIRDLLATTKIVVSAGYREPDLLRFYDDLTDQIGLWAPMGRPLHGRNSLIASRAGDRDLNKCGIYLNNGGH